MNRVEKIVSRLKIEINEIREGGAKIFLRKVRTTFKYIKYYCGVILVFPVIILIRIISPLILVRFGILIRSRIGHYAQNTEVYLCERDAGLHPKHAFDVFCYYLNDVYPCNHQLYKMWDRTRLLRIWHPLGLYLYGANKLLPGCEQHIIKTTDRDTHNLLEHITRHLDFTDEEEIQGKAALRKMGIPEGAKFVCFHARDSLYLNVMYPKGKWKYHDYRNSEIGNYLLAAEELVKRGYYLLRLGAVVEKALSSNNPYIIDYASKYRSDFLDIYLVARCEFILCSGTGISSIADVFRKPIATVNLIPMEYVASWIINGLHIFKKLWLIREKRFMSFREIFQSGAGRFLLSEQYDQLGLEVIENTPEEIASVSVEMDERLKGIWQTTEEDEELQRRFWALFSGSELHGVIKTRIGADFLRNNQDLLK